MRRPRTIVLVSAAFVLGGCTDGGTAPAEPLVQTSGTRTPRVLEPEAYADALVAETNAARVAEGLKPLTPSTCAEIAALGRARELIGQELQHAPLAPVIEACSPMTTAAENLVDSAATPEEVVEAWMNSPGHKANIVDPSLSEFGIGCVEHGTSDKLCSQIFLGS